MPYVQPDSGEEVVISGISGRYPNCQNIEELKEKIMNKQKLTFESSRWTAEFGDQLRYTGEVPNIEKFDATFFSIHGKQVSTMELTGRILMELTCEAIMDAGCNPVDLRGKKVAVVVGACYSESDSLLLGDRCKESGAFVAIGCSRAMLASRISYWLDVHGPAYSVDSACSSSGLALNQCYQMIINGDCDGAIVGGVNLCINPYVSLHLARLGVLSSDNSTKSFDADANGYVRSDALSVVYLQRAKDAKRVYATVVHCKNNCDGFKGEGITVPSGKLQSELLADFYDECGVPLRELNYLEAHSTGTQVGDPQEIYAIDTVLCKERTKPLKIGSIKSNIGHSEAGSGLCAVSKVIIAMETGIIPPNMHYKTPRDSLRGIIEGRLQVVTEKTPWELGYAAVNNFGFGGSNVHILLKSNPKEKVMKWAPNDDLSRLVAVSGRTEAAVNTLLDSVEKVRLDVEYIRLLHDVYIHNIPKNPYRGYAIVGSKHTLRNAREVVPYDETVRPIWFVFSGMGSQWPGMGKMLMRYPVFAEAIQKCDAVLKPRGLDIVQIISADDETIFNNTINCFVGIAAVQIGLVDLLTAAGIVPDRIIGHSLGELGCGYADGCFTANEMVLVAYARGLASNETEMPKGAMAAVALGAETVKKMCPADIDVACHNSSTSSTISGPSASIEKFVAELTEKKIFAKSVATCNIAYHSRYVANAGPRLCSYLQKIIPTPKARSEKWLSTSIPEKNWSTEAAKYCSAEYHTNNLLSPVLFEETAKHIPNNAICIELAPHGLLQAILKRTLPPETLNIPLTLRGHKDNAEFFAQALGKLYNAGLQPKLANIYPSVSFPVSRGTPMISPHIKWDHSKDWYIAYFDNKETIASGERTIEIFTTEQSFRYISGHMIDGRNIMPGTAYIWLVWETMALMNDIPQKSLSLIFDDVRFLHPITFSDEDSRVKLTIMINKGTGYFEILEKDTAVVTGNVRNASNPASEMASVEFLTEHPDQENLNKQDIYTELKIRGYNYQGLFQSMNSAAIDGTKGNIAWSDNYVTFIDNMLQLKIFGMENRSLYVPSSIRKIIIDTKLHEKLAESMGDKKEFPAYVYEDLDLIASGGVQVFGLNLRSISRRKVGGIPVLAEYKFVAHRDRAQVSVEEMILLSCQLAFEIKPISSFKALEVVDYLDDISPTDLLSPMLLRALNDMPLVRPVIYLASEQNDRYASLSLEINLIRYANLPMDQSMLIAVGRNLLAKEKSQKLGQILSSLCADGFILSQEDTMNNATIRQASDAFLDIIIEKCNGETTLLLLRKHIQEPQETEVVSVSSKGLDWLEKVKEIINRTSEKKSETQLILMTQADRECGILGMINCMRKEPGGEIVRAVVIQDENASMFDLDNPFYAQQLQLGLPCNVLQGQTWGSYHYLPLPPLKPKLTYNAYVDQRERGSFSSLKWVEGSIRSTDRSEDQIHTIYAGLAFKDIMLASGKLSEEVVCQRKNTASMQSLLGVEYSGVTARGERVMGYLTMNGIANVYYPEMGLTWEIPNQWSLEDAATVPTAYGTACLAFYILDTIKKDEKILIHSGSGGVGQAAIHLALQEGLEVFTTVSTHEKRRFIRERFPSIPEDHIGTSRDTSFEFMIMKQTKGRGVDVVLNSLVEDKLLASVRCLAPYGRFLEIGKHDIVENHALNMLVFLKGISFMSIFLDNILTDQDSEKGNLLKTVIKDFLDRDKIQPLTRTVFDKEELESAFRYMASGKHIGKVLIKVGDEKSPFNNPVLAYPRFYCKKTGSYVIVGGLGGLGLEVAEWLCSRGARNLVLASRRGITTGYQKLKIHRWRADGINVEVIKSRECCKREDCEYMLKAAAKLGPVDGVFNLAAQLRDAVITNQTIESFMESVRPKVEITKQLDELSRTLCPELCHFVVFSSAASCRGIAGQTNYGYGNGVMERICERRVAEGLPGLAIQWGALGDVGLVASMQKDNTEMEIDIGGTLPQKIYLCMQEMETFLLQSHPVVASIVLTEKKSASSLAGDPLQTILTIMDVNKDKFVNTGMSLIDLGMDSILSVQIREILSQRFDIVLSAAEIRALNYTKLIEIFDHKTSSSMGRKR